MKRGPCKFYEIQHDRVKNLAPGLGQFKISAQIKLIWNCPVEKTFGILVDEKLELVWQGVFAIQRATHVLGCIKRSVTTSRT